MSTKKNTGNHGEKLAADHLRQHGYTILDTNWHCPFGELDIIARKEHVIVFVEVRVRQQIDDALASITTRKRDKLIKAVTLYVQEHLSEDSQWRVDVIAVALAKSSTPAIVHVQDALDW